MVRKVSKRRVTSSDYIAGTVFIGSQLMAESSHAKGMRVQVCLCVDQADSIVPTLHVGRGQGGDLLVSWPLSDPLKSSVNSYQVGVELEVLL